MIRTLLFALLLVVGSQCCRAQVYILGVAQDGGYPHAGCTKRCCSLAWQNPGMRRYVTSLAVVDSVNGKWWLVEATPDITDQLQYFNQLTQARYKYLPEGIFITHAHIGHYTGLMQLGREVMNTKAMPVYVMPKMKQFLQNNGPWSQLVTLGNIKLMDLTERTCNPFTDAIPITAPGLSVTAIRVPHRDEYSETVGFYILLHNRSYFFVPDIDKWEKWNKEDIRQRASLADVTLVDGTFYRDGEIPGRNISEVPHPFVTETMALFKKDTGAYASPKVTNKVFFIHFNHTNPIMWEEDAAADVKNAGFNIAIQGEKL